MTADNDNAGAAAIMASSVNVRTMADGTLRLTLDIEPRHARDAFALFGAPGTPVAMARMTPEAAVAQDRHVQQQAAQPAEPKGGALCKLAAIWCQSDDFRAFLATTLNRTPDDVADPAQIIRTTCGVTTRAELDHNERAAQIFHNTFRLPYQAWQQGRRA
jgi:hypothetical protein